jgi:selenide, water dikinase
VDACVAGLQAAGYAHTAVIGRVLPQGDAVESVGLVG